MDLLGVGVAGLRASPAAAQLVPEAPRCLFPPWWHRLLLLWQRGLRGAWLGLICVSPKTDAGRIIPYYFCRNGFLLGHIYPRLSGFFGAGGEGAVSPFPLGSHTGRVLAVTLSIVCTQGEPIPQGPSGWTSSSLPHHSPQSCPFPSSCLFQLGSTKEGKLARAARITAGPGRSLLTRLQWGAACGWLVVALWDGLGRGRLPPAFCPHPRRSWPRIQPWSETQGVSFSCTRDPAVASPPRLWGDNFPPSCCSPFHIWEL